MGVSFYGLDVTRTEARPWGGTTPAIVDFDVEDARRFDLNQGNAKALLAVLGFEGTEDGLVGQVELPLARRAVMRARATFDRRVPEVVRPGGLEYGAPRVEGDLILLRPVRYAEPAFTREELRTRLERFALLLEELGAMHATHVAWA